MKKLIFYILLIFFTLHANAQVKENLKIPKNPKIGLSLSGGGAKGFAHVGVLKVLDSLVGVVRQVHHRKAGRLGNFNISVGEYFLFQHRTGQVVGFRVLIISDIIRIGSGRSVEQGIDIIPREQRAVFAIINIACFCGFGKHHFARIVVAAIGSGSQYPIDGVMDIN
jgi:hypothetical protein